MGGVVDEVAAGRLVSAIYERAALDYVQAIKDSRTLKAKIDVSVRYQSQLAERLSLAEETMEECREFFRSDPYGCCVNVEGEQICLQLWLQAVSDKCAVRRLIEERKVRGGRKGV